MSTYSNNMKAIKVIEESLENPKLGLSDEVFLFISRLTPMVNVDLLIKDRNKRVLVAWRDDIYSGKGWHIPGGIVRYKEDLETRIQKVAETEIGAIVKYDRVPIAINQIICEHDNRGHFISILYNCSLPSEYIPMNIGLSNTDNGFLFWHDACSVNLVKVQEMYVKYLVG